MPHMLKNEYTIKDWAEAFLEEAGTDPAKYDALKNDILTQKHALHVPLALGTLNNAINILNRLNLATIKARVVRSGTPKTDPNFQTAYRQAIMKAVDAAIKADASINNLETVQETAKESAVKKIKSEVELYTLKDWVRILLTATGGQKDAVLKNRDYILHDTTSPYYSSNTYVRESVEEAFKQLDARGLNNQVIDCNQDELNVQSVVHGAIDLDTVLSARQLRDELFKNNTTSGKAPAPTPAPLPPIPTIERAHKRTFEERTSWFGNTMKYVLIGGAILGVAAGLASTIPFVAGGFAALSALAGSSMLSGVAATAVFGGVAVGLGASAIGITDSIRAGRMAKRSYDTQMAVAHGLRNKSLMATSKAEAMKLLARADEIEQQADTQYDDFKDQNSLTSRTKNFFRSEPKPFDINEQVEQRLSDYLQRMAMSGRSLDPITTENARKALQREVTLDHDRRRDAKKIQRDILINPHAYTR